MVGQKSLRFAFAGVSAWLVAGSSAFVLPSLQVRALGAAVVVVLMYMSPCAGGVVLEADMKPLYDVVQMSKYVGQGCCIPQTLPCREHSTGEAVRKIVIHV